MASSTSFVEISRQDLVDSSTPSVASITDVKHLSSYNWIEALTPTIAVPGRPPLWSPPSAPKQVKKDSGLIYIAQNAARHPDSPLEPLFRSLYIEHPSFDIRSIDVVTDRNNIRKLLSFINPGLSSDGLEAFTIDIEITKNTATFSRTETATYKFVGPHEFMGFGHEFEKAYTTSQISGSTGHHRIISYRFGDLNFIVRHETDGYVDAIHSYRSEEQETDHLSSMLGSISISSTNSSLDTTPAASKLSIRKEGQATPLESALEIKTRVSHKPLEIQEVAPQLWISQTLKLVRAYHHKGMFQRPEVENVASPIKKWEESNQTDLRKLATLTKKILHTVKRCDGNAVVKYDVAKDKLMVWKVTRKRMLPQDLYSNWDDEEKSTAEINGNSDADGESAAKPVEGVDIAAKEKTISAESKDASGKESAEMTKK